VILAMFFPCIATFVALFRKLKFFDGLKAIGIVFLALIIVGTAVNYILD
jgi:ferrous iron transport protein B